MATAREIRRRIRSVRNVAQITRALQLVASSKMRRSQERVLQARPYSVELQRVLARLAAANADDGGSNAWSESEGADADLSLLQVRPAKSVGIVLVTPDRGLSGALAGNTTRFALQHLRQVQREQNVTADKIQFVAVGRRGRDFIIRNRLPLLAEFINLGDNPELQSVRAISRVISQAYLDGEVDIWYLVYPRFVNSVTQIPTSVQLLPVKPPEATQSAEEKQIDYIFEPDSGTIYANLLPRYLETTIYQPILETVASFYAAQFVAMKNATDNATELAADLDLTYNKARQAAITNQILEVVAGAGGTD
jgi:F-type H+-transporting ATPase subunit gamma